MEFKGLPNWICQQEEDLQRENTRRINRQLTGRRCPERRYIVEKMREEYSKYGKKRYDRSLPWMRSEQDR